jgi:hypothetical protein
VDKADAADDEALVAARHPTTAGIGGVVVDRISDVIDADAVTQEFGRVEIEPELPGESSEIVDVRHPRNLFQCRNDDPFLKFRQFHQILGVGFKRISVDLQFWGRHCVEPGGGAGGQAHVFNAFPDALTFPIILGAVTKN